MRFHECISHIVDSEKEKDSIISMDRKDYKFTGKLLHPAVVTISYRDEPNNHSESI
jgi:molecular chaperone GrpE (heat shock protein)